MEHEIQEDDYVISDCGRLGSEYFVSQVDDTFSEFDDCIEAIKEHARNECFYPSVWYVNDHSNIDLIEIHY